jgi:hypothetical protein
MREDPSPLLQVFLYYDTRYRRIRATVVTARAKPAGFLNFLLPHMRNSRGCVPFLSPCKTLIERDPARLSIQVLLKISYTTSQ